MTGDTRRRETAARLRHAIAAGTFDDAQAELAGYRQHVDLALAHRPPNAPPPLELAREAEDLMQWALQTVHAARARALEQVDQISALRRYRRPQPIHTWKIDG